MDSKVAKGRQLDACTAKYLEKRLDGISNRVIELTSLEDEHLVRVAHTGRGVGKQ